MVHSHSLLFSDFDTSWYKFWARELKQNVRDTGKFMPLSNKFWQNAVIAQALSERKLLQEGKTAIGFGVGKERLPALFAKHGVHVIATDQDFRTSQAKHWKENELAQDLNDLNDLGICPIKHFKKYVSLQLVDMHKIPTKLQNRYDFVWSNCALGHLGSIEAGLDFIVQSAQCLKLGGYAVHTTEMNVLSDTDTVTSGDTVVFRPQDIYLLSQKLRKAGFRLDPLRFNLGLAAKDARVTMRPVFGNDYSKIQINGHLATQVVLIISRPKRKPMNNPLIHRREIASYKRALKQQSRFAIKNPFMQAVQANKSHPLSPGDITPLIQTLSVNLKDRPKTIYLPYRNNTTFPLFNAYEKLHDIKPIVLATNDPEDRASRFKADDWHGNQANRPSIFIATKDSRDNWQEAILVGPGQEFAFRLTLDPKKTKPGSYNEVFSVAQEGVAHLPDTKITVTIKRI